MANVIDPAPVAPDASQPTGPDSDVELFSKLKSWTKNALDHLSDWRKEADEAFEFYAGHQWTPEERQAFEADGRIAPIFNLTAVTVDAVIGLEVNNRQDIKFLPRTQGDVQVNELLSSAAMWVRDEAQAEDEESGAFRDASICGLGVTESRKPSDEEIDVSQRDPRECFYDPSAKKSNIVDRRFDGRVVMMDTDEALSLFPGVPITMLNAKWASIGIDSKGDGVERLDYPSETPTSAGLPEYKPKKVCLVEIEWFDWEGITKVYKQAFLGSQGILEQNPLEAWAYNWITGKYDHKKKHFYGLVRPMRDPQKMINKFFATGTHILSTNAKGGLMYERGAFADPRAAEKDWSNPQKNVELTEGSLARGAIQPRTPPPLPTSLVQLMEFSITFFSRVTGINIELLGQADRDQPASLEMQRRQSAVTILASLFDAKRRYHKEQGKTLLALMKSLPPETIVRVTIDTQDMQQLISTLPPNTPPEQAQQIIQQAQQQDEQQRFVQFALVSKAFQDPTLKFDVIVDEAPSSPNQQQEVMGKLAMLSNQGLQLPPGALAIAVKNIGLPATVADDIAKEIMGNNPEVQQLQQQLQQGAQLLQQKEQELQQAKADKALEAAKVANDKFKAETDRIKVIGDQAMQSGGVALGPIIAALQTKTDQLGQAVLVTQDRMGMQ